jgi:uncharacterized membrane protein
VSETQQLAVLVIATLVLGILGLALVTVVPPLFEGNLVVDSYDAVLYENGTLTEQYTYDVQTSGQYRMLYRLWEAPLTFTASPQPSVEINSAMPPTGTVAYAKDDTGSVIVYGDSPLAVSKSTISQLALINEVGIFKPDYFNAGQYTAGYTYLLHPPIEYDSGTTHFNLKLAGENHIPYRTIKITIPAGSVQQVFVYPPSMSAVKSGDTYLITGSAAENENVAVEILAGSSGFGQVPGYRTEVAGLAGKTSSGSFWYNVIYTLSNLLNYLSKAAVILVPLLFLVIYNRYGREKEFTVPTDLSTIPNPALKPWQVNLLFKGDAPDFDEDGYYATLLDLHRRKIISIREKEEGKGIEIRVLSGATTDPYELRVLGFLALVSENGVLDTDVIAALTTRAKTLSSAEEKALAYQRTLTDVTSRVDKTLVSQYIVDGRDHLVPFLLTGIVMFAVTMILAFVTPMQSYILIPAVVLWGVVVVQVVIAVVAPSTLFGHWKENRYKEKLEWDAFSRFLSDMAMIQKYAPADLSMWGEWLVYGTALGVGANVERAMKTLNISIPETGVPIGVMGMNAAFVPLMHFTPPSHGGSGGGGCGGAGGR